MCGWVVVAVADPGYPIWVEVPGIWSKFCKKKDKFGLQGIINKIKDILAHMSDAPALMRKGLLDFTKLSEKNPRN